MGFLDWLRGAPALDDDTLRQQLFEAAGKGDDKEIARLANRYEHQILDAFASWKKVPENLRDDMGAVQRWVHGLTTVARHFAEDLSQPELIVSLQGSKDENPLLQWQKTLEEAQKLMNDGKFQEASEQLAKIVLSVKGLRGSGVDQYLPVTFGMLGECCFQQGNPDRAVGPVSDAVALCEQLGEKEGLLASLSNLYEIQRYRGDGAAAADAADKLAVALEAQERADEAARYRKLSGLVRAGEPLVRVIGVIEGRPMELDEMAPKPNERVQFVFERNRVALRLSSAEVQRGEQLASQGKLEEGLEAFRKAQQLDPYDPQPHYLEGLTLLHLKRFPEAVEATARVEKLAPGWFHSRAQAWIARELAAGRVSHDVFLRLRELEDGEAPPEQKLAMAEATVKTAPHVAAVHLALGNAHLALRNVEAARAAFKAGLAQDPEPDVASRLRLRLALSGAPDAEGLKMLELAADPKGNLVAAAMALVARRTAPV